MKKKAEAANSGGSPPQPQMGLGIRWRAALAGFLVAYFLGVGLGRLLALFLTPNVGTLAALNFLTIFLGAYVAARLAGSAGMINGTMVAVLYIAASSLLRAIFEAEIVAEFLASAGPQVLPPMNMGGLIASDLLLLSAGAAGGLMARGPQTARSA